MTIYEQTHLLFRHAVLIEMRSLGYQVPASRGTFRKDVVRYTIVNRHGLILLDDVMPGVCDNALRLWCDASGFVPPFEQITFAPLSFL